MKPAVTSVDVAVTTVEQSRELWKELHEYALKHTVGKNEAAWILVWSRRIPKFTPKGTCSCQEFFNKWYGTRRPDFKAEGGFFKWSVELHNAVNQKLHKPEWTVEVAKAHYNPQVPVEPQVVVEPLVEPSVAL